MDTYELEAGEMFYFSSIDVERRVSTAFQFLEVNNLLFVFHSIKCKVVGGTPCCQVLDLLPVCSLITVADLAQHYGII